MKQLLFLAFILSSLTIPAQEKIPSNKLLIGFNFSPDYNFRKLSNSDGSSSTDLTIKSRNDIEIPKFGYTTGLNVWFNSAQLAGFETGIQFTNKGYQTNNQDLVYFPPNSSLPVKSKSMYAYQYIGVPLKAKLSFGKKKIRFLYSFGVLTNFLLNVKTTTTYEYSSGKTEEKSQSSTSGFNKIDISPMISFGVDYSLNHTLHLFAEPTFRYGMIKTKDASVAEKLWSAGLNMGVYYALK